MVKEELEQDLFNILSNLGKLYNTEENREYIRDLVIQLLQNNYVLLEKIYNYFVKCDLENNPNEYIEWVSVYIEINKGEPLLVCDFILCVDVSKIEFKNL